MAAASVVAWVVVASCYEHPYDLKVASEHTVAGMKAPFHLKTDRRFILSLQSHSTETILKSQDSNNSNPTQKRNHKLGSRIVKVTDKIEYRNNE